MAGKTGNRSTIGKTVSLLFAFLLLAGMLPVNSILASASDDELAGPVTYSVEYYSIDEADSGGMLLGRADGCIGEAGAQIVLQAGTEAGQLDYFRPDGFDSGVQASSALVSSDNSSMVRVEYRSAVPSVADEPDDTGEPSPTDGADDASQTDGAEGGTEGSLQADEAGDSSQTGGTEGPSPTDDNEGAIQDDGAEQDPDESSEDGPSPDAEELEGTESSIDLEAMSAPALLLLAPAGGNGHHGPGSGDREADYTIYYHRHIDGVPADNGKPIRVTGWAPIGSLIPFDTNLRELVSKGYSYQSHYPAFVVIQKYPAKNEIHVTYNKITMASLTVVKTVADGYASGDSKRTKFEITVTIGGRSQTIYLAHGDSWTSPKKYPIGTEYTVTESDCPNYTVTGEVHKPKRLAEGAREEIINTVRRGMLTISKEVKDHVFAYGDGRNTWFDFEVTINGISKQYSLRDRQRVNIPVAYGSTYTVREVNCAGYTVSGEVLAKKVLRGNARVDIVNTVRTFSLTVSKTVHGGYAAGDGDRTEFSFIATIGGDKKRFSLRNHQKKVFHNIPYGTVYSVSENAAGYTTAGEVGKERLIRDVSVNVVNRAIKDLSVTYFPGTQGTFEPKTYDKLLYGSPTPAYSDRSQNPPVKPGQDPPGKPGYTFAGWQPTMARKVIENATYVAQWKANTYRVTFDAQGGTTPTPETKAVTFGEAYGDLASATRQGYTFAGWFTDPTGGMQVTASTNVSTPGDHTLYAHWNANGNTPYTVIHWLVSSTGAITHGATANHTGTTGTSVTAAARVFDGYTLTDHANTVSRGTVAADGSLVLQLYYLQNTTVPSAIPVLYRGPGTSGLPPTAPTTPTDLLAAPPSGSAETGSAEATANSLTPRSSTPKPAVTSIWESEIPLSVAALAEASEGSWALANLNLTQAGLALAVVFLALYFHRRHKEKKGIESEGAGSWDGTAGRQQQSASSYGDGATDEEPSGAGTKRRLVWRILSLVGAAAAVVLFLLTEDMTQPMVWVDFWTVFHVAIFALQIVFTVIATRRRPAQKRKAESVKAGGAEPAVAYR